MSRKMVEIRTFSNIIGGELIFRPLGGLFSLELLQSQHCQTLLRQDCSTEGNTVPRPTQEVVRCAGTKTTL